MAGGMMSQGKLLVVDDLHKSFGSLEVIKGVSFDMDFKERLVLMGPSGSGKSTLVRCINWIEPPSAGRITFDGKLVEPGKCDIRRLREDIGMVFQQFNVFPHLTALQNVALGPIVVKKAARKAAEVEAMELLVKRSVAPRRSQACSDEWRRTTAGGHSACACHAPEAHAVRRADVLH